MNRYSPKSTIVTPATYRAALRPKTVALPRIAIEVHGVKGLQSAPFRKSFSSEAAFDAWLAKNGDNVTILGYAHN